MAQEEQDHIHDTITNKLVSIIDDCINKISDLLPPIPPIETERVWHCGNTLFFIELPLNFQHIYRKPRRLKKNI